MEQRIDRVERALAGLRVALCVLALGLVWTRADAPVLVIGLCGYSALAVLARLARQRQPTPALDRFFAVADVVLVPGMLVATASSSNTTLVVTTIVGGWIVLNALTGKTRRTRLQVVLYLSLVAGAIAAKTNGLVLLAASLPLVTLAIVVARLQQHRLVGHTIQTAERLQRSLAFQSRPASGEIPSTS